MNDKEAYEILSWLEQSLMVLNEEPTRENLVKFLEYLARIREQVYEAFTTAIKPDYVKYVEKIIEVITVGTEKENK